MKNAWQKAHHLREKGQPLTHENFGRIVKQEWRRTKLELIPKAVREFEECKRRSEIVGKRTVAEAKVTLLGQKSKYERS